MDISKSFLKQFLTSIVFIATFGFGQTDVSGTITSNTTWGVSGSPYTIIANTVIMDGVSLTIDAGVTVLFSQDVYLKALSGGTLIAQGTESDSIYFTVTDINTVTNTEGIEFASDAVGSTVQNDTTYVSGSVFDYCVFQHFITTGGGAISSSDVSLLYKNCSFLNNQSGNGGALDMSASNTTFYKVNFMGNSSSLGGSIYIHSGSSNKNIRIINCIAKNNVASSKGGFYLSGSTGSYATHPNIFIESSYFLNNEAGTGGAFHVATAWGEEFEINNSFFIGNKATSGSGGAGYFYTWHPSYQISNCIFQDNEATGTGGALSLNQRHTT